MKSWGERLVAGLKNWRSRKNDAIEAETPNARHLPDTPTEQSDYETKIKLSIRAVSNEAIGESTQAAELESSDNSSATEDQLKVPEGAPAQAELAPEQAEGIPVRVSVSEQSHQRSKPRTLKTEENHVTETGEAGSPPGMENEGSDKPETPGQALQNEIPASARPEKAHKADGEMRGQIEPDTKPVTQLSIDEPLSQNQTAREEEIASIHAISTVPNSLVKRSVARRSRNGSQDEAVTDEELEALEAENARLKRLLRDRTGAKSNTSDG
ncbi:hypothetical protein BLA27_09705 [Brucella cytisi]|uniref:Uncharacterized protein n=2 Tax=Brucella cytisi TaxID=407152 RepID=A0A1J6HMA7_9HYPH|nr:hypothetical protein BLA27_09705 [Brucella cytisi]